MTRCTRCGTRYPVALSPTTCTRCRGPVAPVGDDPRAPWWPDAVGALVVFVGWAALALVGLWLTGGTFPVLVRID